MFAEFEALVFVLVGLLCALEVVPVADGAEDVVVDTTSSERR